MEKAEKGSVLWSNRDAIWWGYAYLAGTDNTHNQLWRSCVVHIVKNHIILSEESVLTRYTIVVRGKGAQASKVFSPHFTGIDQRHREIKTFNPSWIGCMFWPEISLLCFCPKISLHRICEIHCFPYWLPKQGYIFFKEPYRWCLTGQRDWKAVGIWRKDLKNHESYLNWIPRCTESLEAQDAFANACQQQNAMVAIPSNHILAWTGLPERLIRVPLRTHVFYLIILIKWTPMSLLMRIKLWTLVEFASRIHYRRTSPEICHIHSLVSNSGFKMLHEKSG